MKKYMPLIIGLLLMTFTLKKGVSAKGLEQIKFIEKERLTVYLDSAGIPTVGIGHKVMPQDNLNVGDTITPLQSGKFLRNDLAIAERAIKNNVNVPLNQNQFDALISFIFNVGETAFSKSTLLKKLNNYDYQGALSEFARWKYITKNGVKIESAGLIKRRQYEQDLFNA